MPYRAFVSSTYVDLKDHRAHVISSLRRAGFAVDPMEDWTADSDEPKNFSQDRLNGCDLCVLLVAFRRGYVPDGEALSITQLEYEAAIKEEIDVLPFMLDDDSPWRAKFDERDRDHEIAKWREALRKRHGVQPFNLEPQSIDMTGPLTRWVEKRNRQRQAELPRTETSSNRPQSVAPQITWDIGREGSPYPGLMHFTRKYARVFFGRDDEIREIIYRIHKPEGRFVIISGDSGVGKSSVVDAGILPKLEAGRLLGSESCVTVRMVPGQGSQPFGALMTAVGSFATSAGLRPDVIVEELTRSPDTLGQHVRKIVQEGAGGKTIVLFVDQMEELFTSQDVQQANIFLTALHRATQEKTLWVVATIRSDHLQFCHRHPEMLQVLRGQGHYPLGRVEPFMMHDMVVKPANCAGLKVSENLARHIVNDTASESTNLPLLAFVLNQLFEKRSDHELSEKVYKDLGGVSGAIAEHVKTVEEKMRQDLGKKTAELLPEIFQSLVIVNPEGLPTRRRPLLSGFSEAQRPVVKLLTDERLLQTEGEGEAATVSISHEKLFEAWPALQNYISVNKKSLMDQTLLENRARKWIDMGKPWFGGLASGRELRDFRQAGIPTRLAKEYIGASRRAVLIRIGSILVPLALLAALGTWMGKEGVTVKYVASIALARLHLLDVLDPEADMRRISGGTFQRGDGQNKNRVTIRPFKVSKYEVTFKQYNRFVELTGSKQPDARQMAGWRTAQIGFGGDKHPVINVSWDDATEYAKWLSRATGKSYRLLTEAEWEYAARSGGKDEIWAGTTDESKLEEYAVFRSRKGTEEVGTKKPNGLGLYDMSGNVWEWVEDCWHENYNEAPTDGRAWREENGGLCGQRVIRGGSWGLGPGGLRASGGGWGSADTRSSGDIGFRLAQDIP